MAHKSGYKRTMTKKSPMTYGVKKVGTYKKGAMGRGKTKMSYKRKK